MQPSLLALLDGVPPKTPPLWLMRQAGRYLPEYRALRAQSRSFLNFCYTPDWAVEATLQPIRRFGFDAAILFSDILVIPDGLGQEVAFLEGEGPKLGTLDLAQLSLAKLEAHLDPIRTALTTLRGELPSHTTLLGFCGAPWTVASYMIAGKSSPEQAPARLFAYSHPETMQALIDLLVEASILSLTAQLRAGADAVQIFESFGGALPPALFQNLSLNPIERIIQGVRKNIPNAKIIVFIKGGTPHLATTVAYTSANAYGIDWATDLRHARTLLQREGKPIVSQGNLDPLALVSGGDALQRGIEAIQEATQNTPHIWNLGHGILPETPISHVEELVQRVRGN
jgi:uroporphyrinogen decarboxylase